MDSLPNELLLNIFSYLLDEELERNRCLIWGLSVVNRRFHTLVNEHLYKTYAFGLGHPESFLRTISSSPELARCVKHVTWGHEEVIWGHQGAYVPFAFFNLLSAAEKEHIAARLRALGTVAANQLADAFPDLTIAPGSDTRATESYLNAFLMFTPNIEVLDVAITITDSWADHAYWFMPVAEHGHMFANLVEVKITGPMRIRNVLPLLMVPSLRTLKLAFPREVSNHQMTKSEQKAHNKIFERLREQGSFVEHLHVAYRRKALADILPLLKVFRRLRTFNIETEGGIDTPSQVQLFKDLKECTSLEALRLRDWYMVRQPGVLEALGGIDHLHSLDIDAFRLATPQSLDDTADLASFLRLLPRNLKRLALKAHHKPARTFADLLLGFTPAIRSIFPSLTQLSIVDWDPIWGIFPCQTQLGSLQNGFAEAGVGFTSRPSDELIYLHELHSLDYVEQGWVWVQLVDYSYDSPGTGKWMNRFENWVDDCYIAYTNVEDGWILIYTHDGKGEECPVSEMVMDEYHAEQSLWYWEELRNGRLL